MCYPNPSLGEITFAYSNTKYLGDVVTLIISNIDGTELKSLTVQKSGNTFFSPLQNFHDLANGTYLYTFKNAMDVVSGKFVILK